MSLQSLEGFVLYDIVLSRCFHVPCADFMFNVSIESGAKLLNSPSWDILFAAVYDCGVKVFYGCVYVSVALFVEVCWGVVYICCL